MEFRLQTFEKHLELPVSGTLQVAAIIFSELLSQRIPAIAEIQFKTSKS